MPRPSQLPTIGAVLVLFTLAAGCSVVHERSDTITPDQQVPLYQRLPVDSVLIRITGCGTDSLHVVVDPWEAHVSRRVPFRWVIQGDAGPIGIRFRTARTPFQALDFEGSPDVPIQPGTPTGQQDEQFPYDIRVRCQTRTYVIDPDIIIFD